MINTFRWGPNHTPRLISWLIAVTCAITLTSALTNSLFVELLGIQGPQFFLGLSATGMQYLYFWQPITYLFVQDTESGINLFFLFTLCFNMYLLWVLGTMVYERAGALHFTAIYFSGGVLTALSTLLFMNLWHQYAFLAGPSAALLTTFVIWTMYYPDNDLYFFFLIPLKPRQLLTIILTIILLSNLSSLDFISIHFFAAAVLTGYFYGLLFLQLRSPYLFTHSFDRKVIKFIDRMMGRKSSSKVVDISSASQDDDRFIDAMLTKISKYGEGSLTQSERRRMQKISEQKMSRK